MADQDWTSSCVVTSWSVRARPVMRASMLSLTPPRDASVRGKAVTRSSIVTSMPAWDRASALINQDLLPEGLPRPARAGSHPTRRADRSGLEHFQHPPAAGLKRYEAEHDWLTTVRIPPYAPALNPFDALWSLMRRAMADTAFDTPKCSYWPGEYGTFTQSGGPDQSLSG